MLKVRKLVKVYPGGVTALRGVDLDVPIDSVDVGVTETTEPSFASRFVGLANRSDYRLPGIGLHAERVD